MQYPVEVPGVSVANFLRTAKTAIDGEAPKLRTWGRRAARRDGAPADGPGVRPAQRQRGLLRRREEAARDRAARAAQAEVAILDETDSGLDIDALRVVSEGVNRVRESGETGCC
jgi:Fe-S cluster assembly ATP-binding protein